MALIFEDNKKVANKRIPLPSETKRHMKAKAAAYKPLIDQNVKGSKVLKSLASDTAYNRRGRNAHENGMGVDSISVNDASVRLNRMKGLPKDSLRYDMYGGEEMERVLRHGIDSARSVAKVKQVAPQKPSPTKSKVPEVKPVKKASLQTEGATPKLLLEDLDYYDCLSEYGTYYVLKEFEEDMDGKQDWGVLINPNMYQKALSEFTKYGKFVNFPTRYVYQWMGIIMKNTAILCANTELAGHSSTFPIEDVQLFLEGMYGEGRVAFYNYTNVRITLTPAQVVELCKKHHIMIDEGVDRYGQTYLPWMGKDDIERYVARSEEERLLKKMGGIAKYITAYNSQGGQYAQNKYGFDVENHLSFDEHTNSVIWDVDVFKLLEILGLYDWMEMPDGSSAWSDYGIRPLEEIFTEYDSDLPPEKVIVLVNKALDVYHQRGDMSSIFIQGGTSSLDAISNGAMVGESVSIRKRRKVHITEGQLMDLCKKFR